MEVIVCERNDEGGWWRVGRRRSRKLTNPHFIYRPGLFAIQYLHNNYNCTIYIQCEKGSYKRHLVNRVIVYAWPPMIAVNGNNGHSGDTMDSNRRTPSVLSRTQVIQTISKCLEEGCNEMAFYKKDRGCGIELKDKLLRDDLKS